MRKVDEPAEGVDPQSGVPINRGLLAASGVLLGLGGILGATGLLLGALSLISATRQWVEQLEQPPGQVARNYLQQARAAGAAAASAWQGPGQ
jgi:hypothetical protein